MKIMNKTERLMLLEIYKYSNAVPDIRNNMDFEGYGMHRKDTIEVSGYIKEMSYALLMYGTPEEDKSYWKKKFYDLVKSLNEFIDNRKKEQWGHSDLSYKYFYAGLC